MDNSSMESNSSHSSPNTRNSIGLRRQPTIYPHGLDISVQTITGEEEEPQQQQITPQNYSRASTLRSDDSQWPGAATTNTISTTTTPPPKYRISMISTPESLAELQVKRHAKKPSQHSNTPNFGSNSSYYMDSSIPPQTHDTKKPQLRLLQEYARHYCRWKYMRWPIIFLASVLLFFGLITYCIWLHDVSVARERYLQRRQQQQLIEQELLLGSSTTYNERDESEEPNEEAHIHDIEDNNLESDFTTSTTSKTSTTFKTSTTMTSPSSSTSSSTIPQHNYEVYEKPEEDYADIIGEEELPGTLQPAHSIRYNSGKLNDLGAPVGIDDEIRKLIDKALPKQRLSPSYTSSTKAMQAKVSPTIPPIQQLRPTSSMATTAQDNGCYSTTLQMCRGVLDYDLTYNSTITLDPEEFSAYEQLVQSNCSARAVEFLCASLEPECRPKHIGVLPPCRRICKAILEACSIVVEHSDVLSALFDCSLYPDSSDPHKCEDPTRRRGYCYENEFECYDRTCIPYQWQCDNIKDCATGEDEEHCLECDQEQEFRCRSNEKCIPETERCDGKYDCFDGSDEDDCDDYGSGGGFDGGLAGSGDFDEAALNAFPRIFSYASILSPNQTNEKRYTYITAATDEDNEGRGTQYQVHEVTNRTSGISQEEVTNSVPGDGPINFRDSKEIMMTSDSENKFKYSRVNRTGSGGSHYVPGNTTPSLKPAASQRIAVTTAAPAQAARKVTVSSRTTSSCAEHELRCVSGKCIQVKQLCDRHIDCPDGADELMCVYKVRPATSYVNSTSIRGTTTTSTTTSRSVATASTTSSPSTPLINTTIRTDKRTIRTTLRRKAKT